MKSPCHNTEMLGEDYLICPLCGKWYKNDKALLEILQILRIDY